MSNETKESNPLSQVLNEMLEDIKTENYNQAIQDAISAVESERVSLSQLSSSVLHCTTRIINKLNELKKPQP